MSSEICGDNRFEIIESAKQRLIEATNIESRAEEMAVIDSILFRMWQMGWLPGQERTCTDVRKPCVFFECSECGAIEVTGGTGNYTLEYCPACGAKIEGD